MPKALGNLGLPASLLASHHGWDPGASPVGRMVAARLDAPLHLGRWSRLLVDLNRSEHHPRVVPRRVGRRAIPANAHLDRGGRRQRLDLYWRPWRAAVEAHLDVAVRRRGLVLQISVHSFVPRLGEQVRTNDIGLLFDPGRERERRLALGLQRRLQEDDWSVRRNYPYTGKADGFCSRMRRERPASRYMGLEIELNQRNLRTEEDVHRVGCSVAAALHLVLST